MLLDELVELAHDPLDAEVAELRVGLTPAEIDVIVSHLLLGEMIVACHLIFCTLLMSEKSHSCFYVDFSEHFISHFLPIFTGFHKINHFVLEKSS